MISVILQYVIRIIYYVTELSMLYIYIKGFIPWYRMKLKLPVQIIRFTHLPTLKYHPFKYQFIFIFTDHY
jgi:hypothetical protein